MYNQLLAGHLTGSTCTGSKIPSCIQNLFCGQAHMMTEMPKSLQKCLCFHLDYAYAIYVISLVFVPAKLIIICFGLVIVVQFPCIRAIVIKASKIKVGSLFIVTYTGGTIGR